MMSEPRPCCFCGMTSGHVVSWNGLDMHATPLECVTQLRLEIGRLRSGCNPECPGCGLRPCNERGTAMLWCDECVGKLRAELHEMRGLLETVVDARDSQPREERCVWLTDAWYDRARELTGEEP